MIPPVQACSWALRSEPCVSTSRRYSASSASIVSRIWCRSCPIWDGDGNRDPCSASSTPSEEYRAQPIHLNRKEIFCGGMVMADFTGDIGNNVLNGTSGDDVIFGGGGMDQLLGGD